MNNDKEKREEHFEFHILSGHIARLEGLLNIWYLEEDPAEQKKITLMLKSEFGMLRTSIATHFQENRDDNEKKKDRDIEDIHRLWQSTAVSKILLTI